MSSSQRGQQPVPGPTIKIRKRNIAVPLDPGSFADTVVTIFEDAKETDDLEKNLEVAVKALANADLKFDVYGDVLFELLFAGGRMSTGGNLVSEGKKLETNVLACEPDPAQILPYVKAFQALIRRRPGLVKALENTQKKLIMSLDFFDSCNRQKIAIATARIFAVKEVKVSAEQVLGVVLNDRLTAKGSVLEFMTFMFTDYLATEQVEELVALLRKARLEDRLLELFPPQRRTDKEFAEHFQAAGLAVLVDMNMKKVAEKHLAELKTGLVALMSDEPPAPVSDCIALVKSKKAEFTLSDADIVKVVWGAIMESLQLAGKNQQQIHMQVLKVVKQYSKLLAFVCTSGRLELQLLVMIQVQCYEDSRLLKLFKDIVRLLYDADVVEEDTVKFWYNKGSNPKGRNVFLKDLEPFIKWLEEAEEEEEEEE